MFWFMGSYDCLEYDFKTLKEAEDWVKKQLIFDNADKKLWEEYGYRIMGIIEEGKGIVK